MVNRDRAQIEVDLGASDGEVIYDERMSWNTDPDTENDERTEWNLIYSSRPSAAGSPVVAIVTFITASGDSWSIASTATQYLVVRGFDVPRVGPPWGPPFDSTSMEESLGTVIYGVTVDSPEGVRSPSHHVCPPLGW